ncbi:glycosyltransferase [Aquibaculum sediminis]|uniref:glycosyltransferase n=1 Tax=Aquibaculum sediminis TaxID=3231907 RepID=UPI0034537886
MNSLLYVVAPALLVLGGILLFVGFRQDKTGGRERSRASLVMRVIVLFLVMLSLLRYVWWRVNYSLPDFAWTFEGLWSHVYFAGEMLGLAAACLMYVWLMRRRQRHEQADRGEELLRSRPLPSVALFIATYNEPAEVLEKTLIGATSQQYENCRVYVLDDGCRPWLRALCEQHAVGYIERESSEGAKAGNLNHGLAVIRARGEDPDFIAVLDADFVAMPNFLRRTVAVAVTDPEIAIVQTPQHFYNPDPLQLNLSLTGNAPDEQRFFFDDLMPAHDAWGTAFCCGTSWIGRTRALDAIGGHPTESLTEDMLISFKLREQGHKTAYLNERLSVGLAPESLGEYASQRHRWCLGFMQIFRKYYNPFSFKHNLGILDRISITQSLFYWGISFFLRYLLLLCPAVFWFTGATVFDANIADLLAVLLPWLLLHIVVLAWVTEGRLQPIMNELTQILIMPVAIHASFLGLFTNKKYKFNVTQKGVYGTKTIIQWSLLRPILLLFAISVVVLVLAANPFYRAYLEGDVRLINMSWLIVNTIILAVAAIACVEIPRRRREERFDQAQRAILRIEGLGIPCTLRDLSLSGARLTLSEPILSALFRAGVPVTLELDGHTNLAAQVVRSRAREDSLDLGIRFAMQDRTTRQELVRRTFATGRTATQRFRVNSFVVISKILRGAFR